MINIAIVDDENMYINQIIEYIDQFKIDSGNQINVTIFNDGYKIVEDYKANFDIILMDIQMKFMDGMTAAQKIRQKDEEVIIMFITNMTQYAIKGYEVDALDYILKPVTYFALSQKLVRAIEKIKRRTKKYVSIIISEGVQRVDVDDILYVESQGHALIYHTLEESIVSKGRMKDIELSFEKYGFFRSNKGYLVNMKHVSAVKNGCCVVGSEELLISRGRKNEFMQALADYMSEVIR